MKYKYVGLITVRMSSSRLPKKALLDIGGKSLLENVIDRAKVTLEKGLFSNLVLCTSEEKEDDELAEIARKNQIDCFRGSLKDKIKRWRDAGERFGADYVITIDADDPFCDPELIELAIKQLEDKAFDVITADTPDYVCGGFTHGISVSTLNKICEIKATDDTEMTKPYLIEQGRFNVGYLNVPNIFRDTKIRLTLDYEEDLEFFRILFREMEIKENIIPLREIIKFLNSRPDIVKINFFRQEDFRSNQKRLEKIELKK